MGGLHSRNKGKKGERDVRDLFRAALAHCMDDVEDIRRNHQQAEIGGADLVGLPYFSVEIKRMAKITWGKQLMDWWAQCQEQADTDGLHPCLVFRQDRGKWFVMIEAWAVAFEDEIAAPMILSWENFAWYLSTLKEEDLQ